MWCVEGRGQALPALCWIGLALDPGDEVILPAYTYCATANVVLHRGAKPVLVDLPSKADRDGLNITWDQVAPLLNHRTKVVMPVDIGGWPVQCGEWATRLSEWASNHGLRATILCKLHWEGHCYFQMQRIHWEAQQEVSPLGAAADISIFSFHAVKNITTAEGGAAALALPPPFDNAEVYRTLRSHCLHGQSKDAAAKFNSKGKGNGGMTSPILVSMQHDRYPSRHGTGGTGTVPC